MLTFILGLVAGIVVNAFVFSALAGAEDRSSPAQSG